jgi:transcription antitermination factor NusG
MLAAHFVALTGVERAVDSAAPAASAEATEAPWFALGVTPRHEKTVARILNQKGYETLLPLYANRHDYGNRTREFELPLFPGYVFCRFEPASRMPVLTTPGVVQVVGAGRTPVAVDREEIAAIQTAVRAKARMLPWPFWKTGQRGRVVRGPLKGMEGMVTTVKESVRMVLSVSLLQRSLLVEVDADCVHPI